MEAIDFSGTAAATTYVGEGPTGSKKLYYAHQRLLSSSERRSVKICRVIDELSERIHLSERMREAAVRVFQTIQASKPRKTKKDELLAIVCIAIAGRRNGCPRSFKELSGHCNNVSIKEMGRGFKTYARMLSRKRDDATPHDMVPRFASMLDIQRSDVTLCMQLVRVAYRQDYVPGRNPLSCIGGCLYLTIKLRELPNLQTDDVAQVLGIAANTVRKAFMDLCPHLSDLLNAQMIHKSVLQRPNRSLRTALPSIHRPQVQAHQIQP